MLVGLRRSLARLRSHWAEYAAEMASLALFMMSAAGFATLLQHPASPWSLGASPTALERAPMGAAMGLTAIAMIYSPWGRRSGAHMNPAVTLTFWRLGKIATGDAAFYILAQFAGGIGGIVLATQLLAQLPADPSVNYVATMPGAAGQIVALVAEMAISFGMMLVVLLVSNHPRFTGLTGLCAGFLVFAYITIEAPLSGMSMNPARSWGPAVLSGSLSSLWIYFVAPVAGMALAAEAYVRRYGAARVLCAKLHHPADMPCIFRCRFGAMAAGNAMVRSGAEIAEGSRTQTARRAAEDAKINAEVKGLNDKEGGRSSIQPANEVSA